ncbi:MAG TPA: TIGR00282 family metallophosphoesterase [Thermodesulfobacteriota bacterium]|nr:TIGR00282 family metallophosphoesterase [Thermodesulfobacteriota bacterium]
MRILFIGDIVGKAGRQAIEGGLGKIIDDYKIEFTVANGENAAGGMGITPVIAIEILDHGVDVVTSGNHIWAKKEIVPFLDEEFRILRPANYPPKVPGKGSGLFRSRNGQTVGVLNLEGRVFMKNLDCPFRVGEKEVESLRKETPIILVDFHAEATSEKMAMGWFMDGKVSAVLGTHTHVQTSDERILDGGTAYITDLGMTGPMDSVIGIRKEIALERLLTQIPWKFDVAKEQVELQGVVIDVDSRTGKSENIQKIKVPLRQKVT